MIDSGKLVFLRIECHAIITIVKIKGINFQASGSSKFYEKMVSSRAKQGKISSIRLLPII